MHWSIIYSADTKKENSLKSWKPVNGKWVKTEWNDQYDYDYLGKEYENGKHFKYCGYLSNLCFTRFLNNTLYPVFIESTMGMIGAPMGDGMEYGLMPAFSLSPENYYSDDPIDVNAYICPIPDNDNEYKFLSSMDETEMKDWIKKEYF